MQSPAYSTGWQTVSPATELLINYFWLHWIYLGLFFGGVITVVLTSWLFVLGIPSAAFCWTVWAVLGQASGAYVGPTCWAVIFLAGASAILYERAGPEPPRYIRIPNLHAWLARVRLPPDRPERSGPQRLSAAE